jgi:RimJ/RimL family protein N-acetyltransferase
MTLALPREIDLGDNLVLRTMFESDAEAYFAFVDTHRAYLTEFDPFDNLCNQTLEEARTTIKIALIDIADGYQLTRGLWHPTLGFAGRLYIGLNPASRRAVMGWQIHPHLQGHGYVTRAAQFYLAYLLGPYGCDRVHVICRVDHVRSRQIAGRLGMKLKAVLLDHCHMNDRPYDSCLYVITRDEWRTHNTAQS